jgi:IS30 family transposase
MPKHANPKSFSNAEVVRIRELAARGATAADIASLLNRTLTSVKKKTQRMQIKLRCALASQGDYNGERTAQPVTLPKLRFMQDEISNGGEPAGPKGPGI